ncbi:CHASE2 domain-containing protein [Chlorogloeopsis sp. ULAP01]|uniref:CHASE2 domain-containing protein n=1 Tax=Chlorogloeopsis sp. ULAP01 TaxID=3056483 RepID=UPI0025AA753A|nr:CHASE2 domain-containing protein [Chlorogloeopsis sp. ULAP01]MDM9385500.1 CHASE2 domain-containing protein [Chlorogloeopsis sp. ULAP01]
MGKLVVLKFSDGSFEEGFAVTLQIGTEGELPSSEIAGKLPPATELLQKYREWQSSYLKMGNRYRLSADKVQVTNVSIVQDCDQTAYTLRSHLNSWLLAPEFRPVREKWLEQLLPTDEVRVILQTDNRDLQRLPWHLWDVMERYRKAEIAIAPLRYERIASKKTFNHKVNILAIIGNSQGINTQRDKALLEALPAAEVSFLVEPQRKELNDFLWQKNWDILFFAGHSSSQGTNGVGRIFLNQTDSLSISELKYALRKAVERGLQLAIFNSCDGLGLAEQLADLHIPQIIVMREPVPDLVAQEFLKYFLEGFAAGERFYLAVREAREQLQGLEDKFPCATWLPVICQNLAEVPSTWQDITGTIAAKQAVKPIAVSSFVRNCTQVLLTSAVITTVVVGVRFFGFLQRWELQAFDGMMRSRSVVLDEGPDPRLLLVTIDDADIAAQRRQGESLKGTSVSDKYLNLLLEKLQQYQPQAIGLDIYRDFSAESPDLIKRLQTTDNLIGVCKGSYARGNTTGIEPPPEIPEPRLGFSDFVNDDDGVVRRHLLFMRQEATSPCPTNYAFSTQLALHYLHSLGIQPQFTPQGDLQLDRMILQRLRSRRGGYQKIDTNGGQILLNYRSSKQVAEQVTLTQLLSNSVNPNAIKNRIVLIGVAAKGDFPDYWATSYGSELDKQLPGVLLQAHMISQILSAVIDRRPLLRTWHPMAEVLWIWFWGLAAGLLTWQIRHLLPRLVVIVIVSSGVIYIICLSFLIGGYWVPFVPSVLALLATVSVTSIQHSQLKSQN